MWHTAKTSFVLPRSQALSSRVWVSKKPVVFEDASSNVGVPESSAMRQVTFLKRTSVTESACGAWVKRLLSLTNNDRRIFFGGGVEIASER